MPESKPYKELDCRGMNCPLPVVKTKKAIETMKTGESLKIFTTDPGSCNDIPAFCRRTGNTLLEQTEKPGVFIFLIKKT